MMRELDILSQSKYSLDFSIFFVIFNKNFFLLELISEREALKHDLFRKHPGESKDEEESRIRRKYDEIQTLYKRIDSLTEEKE